MPTHNVPRKIRPLETKIRDKVREFKEKLKAKWANLRWGYAHLDDEEEEGEEGNLNVSIASMS